MIYSERDMDKPRLGVFQRVSKEIHDNPLPSTALCCADDRRDGSVRRCGHRGNRFETCPPGTLPSARTEARSGLVFPLDATRACPIIPRIARLVRLPPLRLALPQYPATPPLLRFDAEAPTRTLTPFENSTSFFAKPFGLADVRFMTRVDL